MLNSRLSSLFSHLVPLCQDRLSIPMFVFCTVCIIGLCVASDRQEIQGLKQDVSSRIGQLKQHSIVRRDLTSLGKIPVKDIDLSSQLNTRDDFVISPSDVLSESKVILDHSPSIHNTDDRDSHSSHDYGNNLRIIDSGMNTLDSAFAQIEEELADHEDSSSQNSQPNGDDTNSGLLNKRRAFAAWAGKRSTQSKRPSFHAWGGKRAFPSSSLAETPFDEDNLDNSIIDKRRSFHSWGGKKRSPFDKRRSFHSWGGKKRSESYDTPDDVYDTNGNPASKRRAFHAWSGKRSAVFDRQLPPNPTVQKFIDAQHFLSDTAKEREIPIVVETPGQEYKFLLTEGHDLRNIPHFGIDSLPTSLSAEDIEFLLNAQNVPDFSFIDDSNNNDDNSNKGSALQKRFWDDRMMTSNVNRGIKVNFPSSYRDRQSQQTTKTPQITPFLDILTKNLGGIEYKGESFKDLLPSQPGRQRIVKALKSLYKSIVKAQDKNKEAETDSLMMSDSPGFVPNYAMARPAYASQAKRPAFHSWSGKRSSPMVKRSANDSLKQTSSAQSHSLHKRSVGNDHTNVYSKSSPDSKTTGAEPVHELSNAPVLESNHAEATIAGKPGAQGNTDQQNNDVSADKRRAFHSWSGKRDDVTQSGQGQEQDQTKDKQTEVVNSDIVTNKEQNVYDTELSPENSGLFGKGKISDFVSGENNFMDKRPAFHSWGGKRAQDSEISEQSKEESEGEEKTGLSKEGADSLSSPSYEIDGSGDSHSSSVDKRGRMEFHSWGGKRSATFGNSPRGKVKRGRMAFHSWGGKRNVASGETVEEMGKRGRMAFHSWGGKRNAQPDAELASEEKRGRMGFHSWGGKRDSGTDETLIPEDKRGRMAFHSWGGKRGSDYGDGSGSDDKRGRMGFHSWGGKRSELNGDENDNEDKRGRMAFHSRGGKRADDMSNVQELDEEKRARMGFHSWGGKRDLSFNDGLDNVEEKRGRMAFHSWGGKRDGNPDIVFGDDMDKRSRMGFHSWGGKRDSEVSSLDDEDVSKRGRMAFHSWGGKRDSNSDNLLNEDMEKRGRMGFHSWGGKRASESDDSADEEMKRGRMAFHSWGGKRDGIQDDGLLDGTDKRGRMGFHSWGGKRDAVDAGMTTEDAEKRGRMAFHSWGGKRGSDDVDENADKRGRVGFHSWGGKRDAMSDNTQDDSVNKRSRMGFHSWGGKRDGNSHDVLNQEMEKRGRMAFHSWGGKRATDDSADEEVKRGRMGFHSWGGKRADDSTDKSLNKDFEKRGRLAFHSWGGKRATDDSVDEEVKRGRVGFHSWGGKRDAGEDESQTETSQKRSSFSPWYRVEGINNSFTRQMLRQCCQEPWPSSKSCALFFYHWKYPIYFSPSVKDSMCSYLTDH